MLTDDEILNAISDAPMGQGAQSFVLAVGRAIEAKLLEREDGGVRAAMVKLSKALGHPKFVKALDGQCVEAALIDLGAERLAAQPFQWPLGLLDRIKAAEKRIENNHAPRRIPADPHGGDVDLVLAEVRYLIEGKWPPFWIKGTAGVKGLDRG
jgi:hypothetical protein